MKAFHEIREYTEGIEVWHGIYNNIGIVAHWHNEIELIFVRSGSCLLHNNSQDFQARAGDLLICDSGDIHCCSQHSPDISFEFLIFSPNLLKFNLKERSFINPLIPAKKMQESGLQAFWENILKELDQELADRQSFYKEFIRCILTAFWCRFLRDCPTAARPNDESQSSAIRRFQKVMAYMEQNCGKNITLEQMASYAGFSPSYASRFFRQLTGVGFLEYLNMLRITRASELLHRTDRRIIEIAYDCGFNNIRNFNRVFLKYTGETPSEFRCKIPRDQNFVASTRSFSEYTTRGEENPTLDRHSKITADEEKNSLLRESSQREVAGQQDKFCP